MANNKNAKYILLGIAALFIILGVATLPQMLGLGAFFLIAASGAFCAAVGIAVGDRTSKQSSPQTTTKPVQRQPSNQVNHQASNLANHRNQPNLSDSKTPAPVLKSSRTTSHPSQDSPFPKVSAKAELLRAKSNNNEQPAIAKVATTKTSKPKTPKPKTSTVQGLKPQVKTKKAKSTTSAKTPAPVKKNANQPSESKKSNAQKQTKNKNIINPKATKTASTKKTIPASKPNTSKPNTSRSKTSKPNTSSKSPLKKATPKMHANHPAKQPVTRNSINHGSKKAPVKKVTSVTLGSYTKLFEPNPKNSEKTAFAHFYYKGSNGEYFETPFQQLADMAVPEHWNYVHEAFHRTGIHLPILLRYINYTFMRLQQQQKIKVTTVDGEPRACFNTGLQTAMGKDIFGVFSLNEQWGAGTNYSQWWFKGWADSYSPMLQGFRPLPEVATYIKDASDLIFDTSYDIDINFEHIIKDQKNRDRLPKAFQTDDILAINAIKGATAYLKTKDRRNRTKAIPFWYPEKQKIQFLFPLRLTAEDHEVLALVADKQPSDKLYKIRTALTMDMAYSNARLLGKPNRDWLNP
ncbi:MAG: DUF3825 domain-containing protein [Cyanobacteria bacterium P01_F01_bin.53]